MGSPHKRQSHIPCISRPAPGLRFLTPSHILPFVILLSCGLCIRITSPHLVRTCILWDPFSGFLHNVLFSEVISLLIHRLKRVRVSRNITNRVHVTDEELLIILAVDDIKKSPDSQFCRVAVRLGTPENYEHPFAHRTSEGDIKDILWVSGLNGSVCTRE